MGAVFYKPKLVRKNSQQTTQTDNRLTENGDRTDGRRRQDDNSGRCDIEENQVDGIKKDENGDDESLHIHIHRRGTMLYSWTEGPFCTMI